MNDNDNKPIDAVEDLVSLEALSAMSAALSPDEDEPSDDHDLKNDNQFLDPSIHSHPRDDLA